MTQHTVATALNQDKTYPIGCVHEIFDRQAKKSPNAVAVRQGDDYLTYQELNQRANTLGHLLQRKGVRKEVFVGISTEQSLDAVVAVMAILKASGAYVPFDRGYPQERFDQMLRDSGVSLILADIRPPYEIPPGIEVLDCSRESPLIGDGTTTSPNSGCTLDSAAYLLYTSGSTGQPKGVIGIHRSIINGLLSVAYAPNEKCCLNASLTFGPSLANLFLPLMSGVPLVILPSDKIKDLAEFMDILERESITRVVLVPSVFEQILDLPRAPSRLRRIREVGLAGAALTPSLLKRFADVMPGAKLHNAYSATEIGTLATVWNVTTEAIVNGEVVIGCPVANTRIYVLDEYLQPLPVGVIGEIYVGAPHLARGYLNQPELTAERFIRDPFSADEGNRLFRTGDRGKLRFDGAIEYVGRVDGQVKIKGFRIELREIEIALATHQSIREVVVSVQDVGSDSRLAAYIVANAMSIPTVSELRNHLQTRLPDYMVPSSFTFLDALPLSNNGKIDRAALPPPASIRPKLGNEYEDPRNTIEATIIEIWGDLLGIQHIGVTDHFLDVGGESIFAVELASIISQRFALEISIGTIFENPTIRKLSSLITQLLAAKPVVINGGKTCDGTAV